MSKLTTVFSLITLLVGGLSSPCDSEYREPRKFPSAKKEPETTQSKPKLFPEEPVLSQHIKNITQDSPLTTNARSMEQTRTSCEMEIERLEIGRTTVSIFLLKIVGQKKTSGV